MQGPLISQMCTDYTGRFQRGSDVFDNRKCTLLITENGPTSFHPSIQLMHTLSKTIGIAQQRHVTSHICLIKNYSAFSVVPGLWR